MRKIHSIEVSFFIFRARMCNVFVQFHAAFVSGRHNRSDLYVSFCSFVANKSGLIWSRRQWYRHTVANVYKLFWARITPSRVALWVSRWAWASTSLEHWGVAGRAPKTRELRRRKRRGGSEEGLCPFSENLWIFHLKMMWYGALWVYCFWDSCVPWIVVVW